MKTCHGTCSNSGDNGIGSDESIWIVWDGGKRCEITLEHWCKQASKQARQQWPNIEQECEHI